MTTTETTPAAPEKGEEKPGHYETDFMSAIRKAVATLYSARVSNDRSREAAAQATLARLRQAAGRKPEEDPRAWMEVLDLVSADLPEKCIGKGDEPSLYEEAAFDALTLYALHQRSTVTKMHQGSTSIGAAAAQLAKETGSASIKSRFDVLLVAASPRAVDHHLRSLVGLFNSCAIPLDYGRLALDLVMLRSPERRDKVRLRWGRDFARTLYSKAATK